MVRRRRIAGLSNRESERNHSLPLVAAHALPRRY
jgi:hypothetical protein